MCKRRGRSGYGSTCGLPNATSPHRGLCTIYTDIDLRDMFVIDANAGEVLPFRARFTGHGKEENMLMVPALHTTGS